MKIEREREGRHKLRDPSKCGRIGDDWWKLTERKGIADKRKGRHKLKKHSK